MIHKPFELIAPYKPTGDQPTAITQIVDNLKTGANSSILLGVTGSGKTFTMANVIQQLQRPTLIMAHNKTLAAQLFSEFREYFPNNAVQYFVSYYDYYQPEAYIPVSDTFIEKESTINQEIEKFRHASTHALLTRRDTIIIASVSCIYGLGSPEVYKSANVNIVKGEKISRTSLLRKLSNIQYERNDIEQKRGSFEVKGEKVTIFPAYDDFQIEIIFFGDEVEKISLIEPLTRNLIEKVESVEIFPAKHYLTNQEQNKEVLIQIEKDLETEVNAMTAKGKLLEAQRLKQRVTFDIEMIRETGTTSGIENYSRYFDRREQGTPPSVLLDYFPEDFLLMIDESHITVPQIGAMYSGDRARKQTLVDYGFRLEGAKDNRPLTFPEFKERVGQTLYVSATPGNYELELIKEEETAFRLQNNRKNLTAEQLIRPTGITDPEIEVRPSSGQIDDLEKEILARVKKKERTLVTTLTKRMAEDLNQYLMEKSIKVQYLHSDVDTIERTNILRDLRLGTYDVLVGINLLREGLDLPEVSLVAILDADKEGFLRSDKALIQTTGRAARHPEGKVIMYADRITGSMERAISETNRRRKIQEDYNQEHGIVPKLMIKAIKSIDFGQKEVLAENVQNYRRLSAKEKAFYLEELREKMQLAALQLNFEEATRLRDEIKKLSKK